MLAAAGMADSGPVDNRERDENGDLVNPDEELAEEDLFEKKKRLAEEAEAKNKPTGIGAIFYSMRKGAANLEAGMNTYGPPYQMDYGGNLPEECSRNGGSLMEVHSLLSEGADPHLPLLTEDEQSGKIMLNTPLHYACKFCALMVAKRLKKADRAPSIINLVNASGTNPLQMACMFSQALPRKKKHYALVLWLIDQGAEVNHVDRAGQTALHFAAYSGRIKVVQLLINRGAMATRQIEFLSLAQETPMDFARENMDHFAGPSRDRPNIESILRMKEGMEKEQRQVVKARRAAAKALEDAAEVDRMRKESRMKDRQEKMEEKQRLRAEARTANPESKSKLAEAMQQEKEARAARMRAREHRAGIWKKAAKSNWDFKTGMLAGSAAKTSLINDCLELSESMRGDEKQEKLRRRWKKLTNTRLVELDKHGNEVTRAQAIANSKAEAAAERAEVEAMADKQFKLPELSL
jgi:hypothetical protein